eukprot:TRINITY_DN6141_c3_g1_i1.p1 TRINITY_DN6141_c3_g1~~TRINITY_DN6141_c3_g1_i1.p1  ORF type:complete len:107 (+),score=6.48 TRINITY_DN6141_c3_g1_i1:992-1312(+)
MVIFIWRRWTTSSSVFFFSSKIYNLKKSEIILFWITWLLVKLTLRRLYGLKGLFQKRLEQQFFALHGDRAPGPDGFPLSFFKSFWEDVRFGIMDVLSEFYETRYFL